MLVPAQARKVINRKRFLGEYERTIYSRFEVRDYAVFVDTHSDYGTQTR
ncbi:MAG: hypothetical protein FWC60_02490 [Firmicutes bacterium]|nr:hypothetical protein [Bacillota bacterium]